MTTTLDFDRFAAAEALRWAGFAAGEVGQSDDAYRSAMREVDAACEMLKALQTNRAELIGESDRAVARHGEATGPLQIELSDPATTSERRIQLRMLVNSANGELKASQEEIVPRLAAVDEEISIARTITGRRGAIENAFVRSGSEERLERLRILGKTNEAFKPLIFSLKKRAEEMSALAANERARIKEGRPKYESIADLEKAAREAQGVYGLVSEAVATIRRETDDIRRARLQELYTK